MGIYRGPGVINDGLVFGYDAGYGVADNTIATRFYPGEPTVNYVTDASLLQSGWTGSYSLIDSATKSFKFNVSNFNGSAGSGQGWRSFMWDMRAHAGSAVTISATIEVPSDSPGDFAWVMMGQCNTRDNGTTTATYLGYSATSERYYKATTNTERITWSGTIGNTGTANVPNGVIGFTVWYNGGTSGTDHFIRVSNVQIEKIAHETPFVNGTRSDTASLIDLKRTASINVGDASFDSNAQLVFDGTDDYITMANNPQVGDPQASWEFVVKFDITHNDDTSEYRQLYVQESSVWIAQYVDRIGIDIAKDNGSWFDGNGGVVTSSQTAVVDANIWYHVVFTFNNGVIKGYLNNVLQFTTTVSGMTGIKSGQTPRRIGRRTNQPLDGSMPVVRLYDTDLTALQVAQNYKAYKNRFNI